jgi:phosphatidylglycerophosphatase C
MENKACNSRLLAVFDLDGTLLRGDSFLPFLVSYAWRRRRFWPLVTLPFHLALYVCKLSTDSRTKEKLLISFLRGESKTKVEEHARWFCASWVARRLRDTMVRKLQEHAQAGHRVILVSASPDAYVPAVARFLGIDEVICTRVGSQADWWDGQLISPNCKGQQKIEQLKAYLQQDSLPDGCYAYGDSRSDLPLLRWVSHGFLVRRDRLDRVPPI